MLTKEEFIKNKTDVYIKSPEKREDYIKVIKKLVELGYHTYDGSSPEKLFHNNYIVIFWDDPDGNLHPRIGPDGKKEIQVSDILGEDWDKSKKWWKNLKKGDYVVALENSPYPSEISQPRYFLKNFIYKIYNNNNSEINIYYTREDETQGGGKALYFRTATQEEVKLYKHAGKPVDVTTYRIPESDNLELKDLVKGEIYFYTFKGYCDHISMYSGNYTSKYDLSFNYVNSGKPTFKINTIWDSSATDGTLIKDSLRLATSEEKQWLNVCIAEGNFVEKDYALRGYDMYGKALKSEKEFVLPEKWCVKVASENADVLTNWVKSRPNFDKDYLPIKDWVTVTNNGDNSYQKWIQSLPDNFSEITFEQFKKYVLNKETLEPSIPEYVECVTGYSNYIIPNYIYNVINRSSTDNLKLICNIESHYRAGASLFVSYNEFTFKPSTKEAYDAQARKEMKFEKGKWYKNLGNMRNYIAKFDKIENNNWHCLEYIWQDLYHYTAGNLTSDFKYAEETSLEEIQQYLPNGHPDKIKSEMKQLELKVGKWYTYVNMPNSIICNQGNDRGYGIWSENWNSSPTACYIGTTSEWRELSDKEVEERLLKYAKEHYPVGTKFKSAFMDGNSTYNVELNNYFMWRGLDGVVVNDPNGASIYHKGEWAEIISKSETKSEEPPCKVGDYIYIIDATKNGKYPEYAKYNENIIEVTKIYKEENNPKYGGWWINYTPSDFSGGGCRINGSGWQWNKHVRLATDDEIHKFKSGWKISSIKDLPEYTKSYPLVGDIRPYMWTAHPFESEKKVESKPKLKLKSNKKVKISKKQIKVSNKHLI